MFTLKENTDNLIQDENNENSSNTISNLSIVDQATVLIDNPNSEKFALFIETIEKGDILKNFQSLTENELLHDLLLSNNNQKNVITFLEKYSSYIDLNSKHMNSDIENTDEKNTLLHLLCLIDVDGELVNTIFNKNLKFKSPLDLYATNSKEKIPNELLTNEKAKQIFGLAMGQEFINHFVLVSSLSTSSLFNYLSETDQLFTYDNYELAFNEDEQIRLKAQQNIVIEAIVNSDNFISNKAKFANHLDLETNQYTNSFVDRPHIHWSWNGLIQSNIYGNWENALIAFIEPMKNTKYVMGCAPFDTMTMGPHQLSAESCILIPQGYGESLKQRLSEYKGQIIEFDPKKNSLRDAVHQLISKIYPDTFKLLNKNKTNIATINVNKKEQFDIIKCNYEGYNKNYGNFDQLFLKTKDDLELPLMIGNNTIKLPAFSQYSKGRLIGLHSDSPTDIEKDSLMQTLGVISKDPNKKNISKYKNNLIELVGIKQRSELISIKSYTIYEKIHQKYSKDSGAHVYADYLVKKALSADFRSMTTEQLKPGTLKEMIDKNFELLLLNLGKLKNKFDDFSLSTYRKSMEEILNNNLKPKIHINLDLSIWQSPPIQQNEVNVNNVNEVDLEENELLENQNINENKNIN